MPVASWKWSDWPIAGWFWTFIYLHEWTLEEILAGTYSMILPMQCKLPPKTSKALYNFYVVNAYNSSCSENKGEHEYSKHTEFFIMAPGFSDSCLRSSPPGKDRCPQIITMQTNSAPCQSAASNGRGLFPGISTARTGAILLQPGDCDCGSRGGKCGDQFSPRSCATQYHKAVSCAIHSFTEAHTKPLFAHSE